MDTEASRWVAKLRLKKHPEGGYFRETYRSEIIFRDISGYEGKSRRALSAIYYLLADKDQVSTFHRLKSDEIWHHYAGGSLALYKGRSERLARVNLGKNRGERPQALIERNLWAAASIISGSFCLVGCTVSPAFDYEDWELGRRSQLLELFPRHKKIIERHTPLFNSSKKAG